MKKTSMYFITIVGLASILSAPSAALAQVAPPPGAILPRFSVLGNSGVTGSAGVGTVVSGDVGSSPTASITNFVPVGCCSSVTPGFTVHFVNDLIVQQARADAIAAYNFLAAEGAGTVRAAQLNGAVLPSGIYSFVGGAADLAANGTLTLTGPGIFVFQVASTLTANVGSNVVLAAGANPCNVFWRVGTSATLNGLSFAGNVFADASITVGVASNVTGKTIAGTGATGAVTMAGGPNTIGGCAVAPAAACPVITVNPASLPNGSIGNPYSQTVSGSGGVAPYTFLVTAGALPNGLLLNQATGVIAGTPTVAGPFNFTIQASDANACPGTRAYNIAIAAACPVITVNPASLPNGSIGNPYSQTVSGSGGLAPYTFLVTAGALPNGLLLNQATGVIAGTPTVAGPFNFTIQASDSNGCPGTRVYNIAIAAACPVITVNPASLPNVVIGVPYNQTVSGSGGLAPYSFAVTAGALPNGLVLNNATGDITGTPTAPGTFNFTITATDANGCQGTRAFAVGFTAGGGPTLDVVGLSILMALLVGAGLFVMNRLSI